MALIISDEILNDVKMSADEMRLDFAVWLFQTERISIGKAAKIAGISRFVFQKILAERQIPVIRYTITDIQDELLAMTKL
jgi:predicted HTH domain antitoxin